MEAKCLHDFNATADDELSFCRGTVIKVSTIVKKFQFLVATEDGGGVWERNKLGWTLINSISNLLHEFCEYTNLSLTVIPSCSRLTLLLTHFAPATRCSCKLSVPPCLIQVIDKAEDENWFRAELNGREGYVPSNYIEMLPHPWYQQKIRRSQAEDMLLAQEELPEGNRRYKYEGSSMKIWFM